MLYNLGSGSWLAWANDTVCGHPLLASANNRTRGLQLADISPPQSATLGLHAVARKLLFISRPADGKRLSWPCLTYFTWAFYQHIRFSWLCCVAQFCLPVFWSCRAVRQCATKWRDGVCSTVFRIRANETAGRWTADSARLASHHSSLL